MLDNRACASGRVPNLNNRWLTTNWPNDSASPPSRRVASSLHQRSTSICSQGTSSMDPISAQATALLTTKAQIGTAAKTNHIITNNKPCSPIIATANSKMQRQRPCKHHDEEQVCIPATTSDELHLLTLACQDIVWLALDPKQAPPTRVGPRTDDGSGTALPRALACVKTSWACFHGRLNCSGQTWFHIRPAIQEQWP